jgi:hypothetical protein
MKKIRVIAGRAGSGKSVEAYKDINYLLTDRNNFVFLIGYKAPEYDIKCPEWENKPSYVPENFQFFDEKDSGVAVGKAIDLARMAHRAEKEEEVKVFLFVDSGKFNFPDGSKELFVAACESGVDVTVVVQVFSQLDGSSVSWLKYNCEPMIVSKDKAPRLAKPEEIMKTYR